MALIKSSLSYSPFDMVFTGLLIISCDHPVKVGMKATCQLGTRKAGGGVRKHTLSRFYPMRLINIHFSEFSQLDSWSCVDQIILSILPQLLNLGLLPFSFSQDRNFSLLYILSIFFNKTSSNGISSPSAVHSDKTFSFVHVLSALWLPQLSFCSFIRLYLSRVYCSQWAPFDHFISSAHQKHSPLRCFII